MSLSTVKRRTNMTTAEGNNLELENVHEYFKINYKKVYINDEVCKFYKVLHTGAN